MDRGGGIGPDLWGSAGDVRRCEHGRVMIGYERPGLIPAEWADLSPVFDPIKYRRAVRALAKLLPEPVG